MYGRSIKRIYLIAGVVLMMLAVVLPGQQRVQAAPVADVTSTPEEPKPTTPEPTTPKPVTPEPTTPEPTTPEPAAPTQEPSAPKPTAKPRKHDDDGNADPAITKTVDQRSAKVGDIVGFSLFVTNLGDETAKDVMVTDSVAGYLELVDVTTTQGTVNRQGQMVSAALGSVEPGQVLTVRMRARLVAVPPQNTGTNTATVTTSSDGDNPDNNVSTVSFEVSQPAPTLVPTEVPTVAPPVPSEVPPPPTAVPAAPRPVATPAPSRLPVTGDGGASEAMRALLMLSGMSLLLGGAFKRRGRR